MRVLAIFLGLAAWWLLVPLERYLAVDGWRLMSAGLPILVVFACILFACFKFRNSDWIVVLWCPPLVLSSLMLFEVTSGLLGELQAPGGGEPAPLEGVASLLGLSVWAASLVVCIACLVCFPRKISWGLLAISLANCAVIAFTIWSTAEAEALQIITVRILDKFDKPVTGAEVTYRVYGYGPRGTRPSWPELSGGPILTNDQGLALIRSKKIRHEVLMDVSKSGCQTISAELGMQFDKYWSNRDLRIHLGKILNIAQSQVSSADPVVVTLYLPPLEDSPQPLRFKQLDGHISKTDPSYRFLDFQSGFLVSNPNSDLRFDFMSHPNDPNGRKDNRIKVTALRGSGIVQVPFKLTPNVEVPMYEQMMLIAPASGYSEQVILADNHSPGPWLYFRNADGTVYARLAIDGYSNGDGSGHIHLWFVVNPTGSRSLIFDNALQSK